MNKTLLEFDHNPSIVPTLFKALLVPRPGIQANELFPKIEGKLKKILINKKNLKDYCRICQIPVENKLPPLYPHVIVGPLHMYILTHRTFPMKLLGAVHKYNTVRVIQDITVDAVLDIDARLGQPKYFPKGLEFDITTEVFANGNLAWTEVSTFFVRKSFKNIVEEAAASYLDSVECEEEIASWKLSNWAGKKYAMVCKDFNPIHISGPLAKLFGFKKDLVHGMCSAAQSLGKSGVNSWQGKTIKLYFKGPSYMGQILHLKKDKNSSGRFDLFCGRNERPVISIGIE